MSDNNLQISFDYKYPDMAVLIIYRIFGGGMFLGDSARMSVVKTYVGEEAVKMYSLLTGKSIPDIHKEAGVPAKKNEGNHCCKTCIHFKELPPLKRCELTRETIEDPEHVCCEEYFKVN